MGLLGTPHHHIALLLSDSVAANGKESLEPKKKKKKKKLGGKAGQLTTLRLWAIFASLGRSHLHL